jgi:polar amino acid transport system permease protein
VQSDTFRSIETYLIVAAAYLALSLLMRVLYWAVGSFAFPRRRRLGTPL